MRLRIGLTGGIGSGKSTIARFLVARGATLVDTDAIARALTAPGGGAIPALRQAFGAPSIAADGSLDRSYMRGLVFGDAGAKQRLEALLHPLIGQEARRQADTASTAFVVFDIPLLAESGHWRARLDRVLVIDCTTATQIERVMQRSGWTRETVEAVIAQQAQRDERRATADAVIHNEHVSLEALAVLVERLLSLWLPGRVEQ
jgi:dephospho-CoA kinase